MQPYQEVTALRKEGCLEEAYSRGYELLKEYPEDEKLRNSIGWVLYEKIKNIVNLAHQPKTTISEKHSEEIRQILRKYAALKLSRPDLLFSLLLAQTIRFPKELEFFPKFMQWAGIESFRIEDYRVEKQSDKIFEPLIEKAARETGKIAQGWKGDSDLQEFSILLINNALLQAEVQKPEWLHYHKALLLKQLGRLEEAKTLLLSFIQVKRNEFWAWRALGKVVENSDTSLALALYAKACLTCNDLNFGVGVFEDLSRLAAHEGKISLAKWAADQAFTTRNQNQWKIPQSLRELLEADWYSQAKVIISAKEVLLDLAADAEKVIWVNCPRYSANFLGIFTTQSGKQMAKFGLLSNRCSQELASPARGLLNNVNLEIGEPVTVTVDETDEHRTVVLMEKRQSGIHFDQLERIYGIVDHHHEGKAFIYLNPQKQFTLTYTDFPVIQTMKPGMSIEMICARHRDRINPYQIFAVSFRQTENISLVVGVLRLHPNGFGFVGDAFVSPELASQLKDGQEIHLIVAKKLDKRKNQLGWKAIALLTYEPKC
ncbi:DUF7017 domain-containing protein [Aulosira sp. FACHB-615]|uniref:DUF7017 domain-containing protein n=1 Tax=Aulosira sp. FACHB-615 TaxID=2692777 RepID=UPI0016826372|nr:hypothetical protein [Aulosira sp. FACHB-615]MBD2488660.1 hypothetical protein [Aulosira sp. FACHB-615]